ncbi:uncharacterized protein VTP21DRAFT_8507 [Calcarisporiella thermophila]|uniref:uncharacterized protein n=1 Tax=Calcarisporiella thermophila TaxID=911321 RepID=UPI00374353E7
MTQHTSPNFDSQITMLTQPSPIPSMHQSVPASSPPSSSSLSSTPPNRAPPSSSTTTAIPYASSSFQLYQSMIQSTPLSSATSDSIAAPSSTSSTAHAPPTRKPRRTPIACSVCHQRKVRCDGKRPTCSRCVASKTDCHYPETTRRSKRAMEKQSDQSPFDAFKIQRKLDTMEYDLYQLKLAISSSSAENQTFTPQERIILCERLAKIEEEYKTNRYLYSNRSPKLLGQGQRQGISSLGERSLQRAQVLTGKFGSIIVDQLEGGLSVESSVPTIVEFYRQLRELTRDMAKCRVSTPASILPDQKEDILSSVAAECKSEVTEHGRPGKRPKLSGESQFNNVVQNLSHDMLEAIVNTYKKCYYWMMPVICPDSLLAKIRAQNVEDIDPAILHAVAGLVTRHACIVHRYSGYDSHESALGIEKRFVKATRQILRNRVLDTSVETLQATLLMAFHLFYIKGPEFSSLYIALAVRKAQDMGMHKIKSTNPDYPLLSLLWWQCYILDFLVSEGTQRPPIIRDEEIEIEVPELPNPTQPKTDEFWADFFFSMRVKITIIRKRIRLRINLQEPSSREMAESEEELHAWLQILHDYEPLQNSETSATLLRVLRVIYHSIVLVFHAWVLGASHPCLHPYGFASRRQAHEHADKFWELTEELDPHEASFVPPVALNRLINFYTHVLSDQPDFAATQLVRILGWVRHSVGFLCGFNSHLQMVHRMEEWLDHYHSRSRGIFLTSQASTLRPVTDSDDSATASPVSRHEKSVSPPASAPANASTQSGGKDVAGTVGTAEKIDVNITDSGQNNRNIRCMLTLKYPLGFRVWTNAQTVNELCNLLPRVLQLHPENIEPLSLQSFNSQDFRESAAKHRCFHSHDYWMPLFSLEHWWPATVSEKGKYSSVESREALARLIGSRTLNHLVDVYQAFLSPMHIYQDWVQKKPDGRVVPGDPEGSTAEVNAWLLAHAAIQNREVSERDPLTTRYKEKACSLVHPYIDRVESPAMIHTLLNLAIFAALSRSPTEAFLYLGCALRKAQHLNWYRKSEWAGLHSLAAESRKRLSLSLYLFDCITPLWGSGRPRMVTRQRWELDTPSVLPDDEDDTPIRAVFMVNQATLMDLITKIHQTWERGTSFLREELPNLERELSAWYRELPDEFRYDLNDIEQIRSLKTVTLRSLLLVNIEYHIVWLRLHLPLMAFPPDNGYMSSLSYRICLQAVDSILRCLELYSENQFSCHHYTKTLDGIYLSFYVCRSQLDAANVMGSMFAQEGLLRLLRILRLQQQCGSIGVDCQCVKFIRHIEELSTAGKLSQAEGASGGIEIASHMATKRTMMPASTTLAEPPSEDFLNRREASSDSQSTNNLPADSKFFTAQANFPQLVSAYDPRILLGDSQAMVDTTTLPSMGLVESSSCEGDLISPLVMGGDFEHRHGQPSYIQYSQPASHQQATSAWRGVDHTGFGAGVQEYLVSDLSTNFLAQAAATTHQQQMHPQQPMQPTSGWSPNMGDRETYFYTTHPSYQAMFADDSMLDLTGEIGATVETPSFVHPGNEPASFDQHLHMKTYDNGPTRGF